MAGVSAHVYISGIVQGVFFRDSTRRRALERGVVGWVRNLPDGRVEAYFEGNEEAVRSLVEWCHHGPPGAVVDDVEVEWGASTGQFSTFTIRPTPM